LELTHRWEIRKNNCNAQFQTNLILEVEIKKKYLKNNNKKDLIKLGSTQQTCKMRDQDYTIEGKKNYKTHFPLNSILKDEVEKK
jgi:hypothetical protein